MGVLRLRRAGVPVDSPSARRRRGRLGADGQGNPGRAARGLQPAARAGTAPTAGLHGRVTGGRPAGGDPCADPAARDGVRTGRRHRRGDGDRVRGGAAARGTVPADRGRHRRGRHRGPPGGDVRPRGARGVSLRHPALSRPARAAGGPPGRSPQARDRLARHLRGDRTGGPEHPVPRLEHGRTSASRHGCCRPCRSNCWWSTDVGPCSR
ncbi:hypothetical protein ACRAWF_43425 [Streptomyces sp. L7]